MKKITKDDILGTIKRPKATGEFVVSLETIQQPFVENDTVVRACCLGCGHCLEISRRGAELLAKLAKVKKPDSWQDYYFVVYRCILCDNDYKKVVLKKVE